MKTARHRWTLALLAALLPASAVHAAPKPTPEELSAMIVDAFGGRVRHDPARVREALAAPAGTKIAADEDGDGQTDAFYFVDNDPRHQKEYQPLMVKAVPPDGGNFPGGRIDMANVLFSADWHGDGFLDRIVAHLDEDGDGDIDRELMASPWHDHYGPLQLVLARDVGDDNRLWFHRNYWTDTDTYWWRSDFNGDEVFHFFTYEPATKSWVVKGEGPFAFFDHDKDGYADEVVRRDARTTLRWSFDLDQDANPVHIHDYDLSLTATMGPGELEPAFATGRARIGKWDASGFLPWERAREWAGQAAWQRVMLTWDEWDNNINMQSGEFPREGTQNPFNERWEGVLNHPALDFPQVGGPSGGIANRRMEVDADNSGGLGLYTTPVDRMIHLQGAEKGSLRVDFDFDGRTDMETRTTDADHDGYFDLWEVDVDGDGVFDLRHDANAPEAGGPHPQAVAREFDALAAFHCAQRRAVIDDQVKLVAAMKRLLRQRETGFVEDEAETFYRERLGGWMASLGLGEKMRASLDCERFYAGIIRHRYFARLLNLGCFDEEQKRALASAYWGGDDRRVVSLMEAGSGPLPPEEVRPAGRQLTVTNPHGLKVWQQPVVVDLKAAFSNQKVPVDGVRVWNTAIELCPRQLPSQCDDLDGDGAADELVFAVNLRPGEQGVFRLELAAGAPSAPAVEVSRSGAMVAALARTGELQVDGSGAIRFAGLVSDLRDVAKAGRPAPGIRAGGGLASMDGAPALEMVRSGPVRGVLASADRSVVLLVYALGALGELRWSGKGPLQVALPESASARMFSAGGAAIREVWEDDLGRAAWWREKSGVAWDGGRRGLAMPGAAGGSRLWLAGHWFGGDRVPVLPARVNWSGELKRQAQLTLTPLKVELGN